MAMAIGRNYKALVPIRLCIIFMLLLLQSGHPLAAVEKENNSSDPSVSWSIGRETNDLRKGSDSMESLEEEGDEFTGGFSTLDSMLQWAIGSSPHNLRSLRFLQFLDLAFSYVLLFVAISLVPGYKHSEH